MHRIVCQAGFFAKTTFETVRDAQAPRGGRQSGAVAQALGVLNNPPNANGDYNFK